MRLKINPKGRGAVLFGQYIAERKFNREEVIFALLVVLSLYILSFRLLKVVK